MPTFLSDPPQFLLLGLAVIVLVAGAVWFNRRDRPGLLAFGGVLLLAGLVVLLDRLFESPREEAVRAAQTMVKAADTRDTELFVAQLADSFQYQGESGPVTVTRDQIRKAGFWNLLKQYNVHVAAWDFSRSDVEDVDANTVEIGFLAKGEAEGKQMPMYFRARFARQPDGKMRLTRFASFDPMKRQNERKGLPGFP